jgi:hypothetical protein
MTVRVPGDGAGLVTRVADGAGQTTGPVSSKQ